MQSPNHGIYCSVTALDVHMSKDLTMCVKVCRIDFYLAPACPAPAGSAAKKKIIHRCVLCAFAVKYLPFDFYWFDAKIR